MCIPGLKICSASKPQRYGLAKSMIATTPGVLLLPVKLMKTRGPLTVDNSPLHKATLQHVASDDAIARGKAVTVLTYLHGTKESEDAIETLKTEGYDVDLIELTGLKPFDKETVETSLKRTHKSRFWTSPRVRRRRRDDVRAVAETLFDELDACCACMEDASVLRHRDGEGDGEARVRSRRRGQVHVLSV